MKTYPRRFYKDSNRTPISYSCEYMEIIIEYPSQKKKMIYYTIGNQISLEQYISDNREDLLEQMLWEDTSIHPNKYGPFLYRNEDHYFLN